MLPLARRFDSSAVGASHMAERNTGNPIFVGGVPRSGTTLLRVILDTHPRIFCGTELRVVHALATLAANAEQHSGPVLADSYAVSHERLRGIFAELILDFLTPAWHASGKPRVAEKTPSNVLVFPQLHRLFPSSPLIHVIRDVRDVVASRLERDKAAASAGFDAPTTARIRAREWVDTMTLRRQLLSDPDLSRSYYELRYESLVSDPEPTLRPLFEFLGETFDPAVLEFHRVQRNVAGTEEWSAEAVSRSIFTSSVGRWQQTLTHEEVAAVIDEAREASKELGYDIEHA